MNFYNQSLRMMVSIEKNCGFSTSELGIPKVWGNNSPRRCILVDTIHQPRLAAKEHRLQLDRVLHVQLNDAIAHDHIRHGEEKGDETNSTNEHLDGPN